jgi:hypothetical protein
MLLNSCCSWNYCSWNLYLYASRIIHLQRQRISYTLLNPRVSLAQEQVRRNSQHIRYISVYQVKLALAHFKNVHMLPQRSPAEYYVGIYCINFQYLFGERMIYPTRHRR